MIIPVKVYTGKLDSVEVELYDGATYFDLLNFLRINPETVVVLKDGIPVAFDSGVENGNIEVLRVVSGG